MTSRSNNDSESDNSFHLTNSSATDSKSSESSDLISSEDSSSDSENVSDDENNEIIWDWKYNVSYKILKSFNGGSNTLHQYSFKLRPIDCFMLLFTEELSELICEQTNIYGKQNRKNWTSISIVEIKTWIGINILMGYHKLPSYKNIGQEIQIFMYRSSVRQCLEIYFRKS